MVCIQRVPVVLDTVPEHGPQLRDYPCPGTETRYEVANQTPPDEEIFQGKLCFEQPGKIFHPLLGVILHTPVQ